MLTRNFAIDENNSMVPRSGHNYQEFYQSEVMWRTVYPAAPAVYSTTNRLIGVEEDQWNGWDIPDFHAKIRRGELLPFTPWGHYVSNATSGGFCDITVGTSPGVRFYVPVGYNPYSNWFLSKGDALLLKPTEDLSYLCTEAMAKIYSNGFDALTNIAEFTSVVKMFRQVAKRLADFILYLPYYWRKLNYKQLLKLGKDGNNEWLQQRYGWRILIYDMLNLHKAIVDLSDNRKRFSERSGFTTTTHFDDSWETDHVHYKLAHTIKRTLRVSARGSAVSDIEFPRFQFNPIQTAWELIPLSFVVDWVFNVGRTIAGITYAFRPGEYRCATGYKMEIEHLYENKISYKASTFLSGDRTQQGMTLVEYIKRIPSEISLIPHFTLHINSLKVVDLIALIVQRIGSK